MEKINKILLALTIILIAATILRLVVTVELVQYAMTGKALGVVNICVSTPPVLAPMGNQTATVGQLFTLYVNATDAENDKLFFEDNATFFNIDILTGLINFTPASSDIGVYTVKISVYDSSCGLSDYEIISFTVLGFCGDGVCSPGETCSNCPEDCGVCPSLPPTMGGGGAFYVKPLIEETKTIENIPAGGSATIKFEKSDDLKIEEIKIDVKNAVTNLEIKIKEDSKPKTAPQPIEKGKTYKYLNFTKKNIKDADINKVTIKFKVDKSWIFDNGIDSNTVAFKKWADSQWSKLPITLLSENDDYYYYETVSTTLSMFVAITGEKVKLKPTQICVPKEKQCLDNELQQCKSDGTAWLTIEPCVYGCDSENLICKPAPKICTPDEKRCMGDELQECNVNGTEWATIETCEYGCDPDLKKCREAVPFVNIWYILAVLVVIMVILGVYFKKKKPKT